MSIIIYWKGFQKIPVTGESNGFIGNGGPDYEYYTDSKKTDKLKITKFSNIEFTIKHGDKIEKVIYCLDNYAIKLTNYELFDNECGIKVKYINTENKENILNINSPYKISIINVKLIL